MLNDVKGNFIILLVHDVSTKKCTIDSFILSQEFLMAPSGIENWNSVPTTVIIGLSIDFFTSILKLLLYQYVPPLK